MMVKLLLTSVIRLFPSAWSSLVAGLVVICLYLAILLFVSPYNQSRHDRLALGTSFALALILFSSLIMESSAEVMDTWVDTLFTIMLFAVLLLAFTGFALIPTLQRLWRWRQYRIRLKQQVKI